MSEIRLTVIIPTHNRKELLIKALDSLAAVRHQPGEMEVIVVDDGSSDRTADDLAARKDSFLLKVMRNEKATGPAAARNKGAFAARGEILGFLDSDIIVDPDWWQSAEGHFHDTRVAGVEGVTTPPADAGRPTPFTHVVANPSGGNYLTCNIFYRKSVFQQCGGFDERFRRANREDSDFAFTLLDLGFLIVFEPKCKVEHPLFPSKRTVYLKEAAYGLHEALLRRKHPVIYKQCLKWIDGRAFPVFYWGVFLGLAGMLLAWALHGWLLGLAGAAGFGLGWSGSVYAVCRKRKVTFMDLFYLVPQYVLIPWIRLYWVLRGEWKYRKIQPVKTA